ncbi:unnamed protein product [Durusdinium trenchii]|uniref:Fibronectin type-III domain-containing protein n=1 Tax=Durusdinium trenchii TaxID=1381693 RepID=A0ABP0MBP5_9DINO
MVLLNGPQPIEGRYVTNWSSVPSEPVATFVDPPVGLTAELSCDCDVVPATVSLSWKSSNFESLRQSAAGSPVDMDTAFASWPGLMPIKIQVRWRVVRCLSSVGEALPKSLASGNYTVSAAIDNLVKDADFRIEDDTWHYTYKEALHGVICVFSVRVGTAFKWSPWSEDSPALVVEVHEPSPPGVARSPQTAELDEDLEALARSRDPEKASGLTAKCIEIRRLTDSEGEATWMPFTTEGLLTWVEYRVTVCSLDRPDDTPQWEKMGIVAGVVQIRDKVDQVTMPLRGLLPNQWYCIQVDARYPYVGKRAFSDRKALSPPFLTPFPSRPPLQPIPVRMELDEELEELPPEEEGEDFRWALRPWVSLRVEKGFLPEKYVLQYKEAVGGGEELGKEHFEGWQEPVVVERFSKDKRNTDQWDIVRVGLPSGAPEVVLLRLMTLSPKTAAPLQWSSASPPVVSSVAVPRLADLGAGTVMRLMPTSLGFRLFLRFFLQPGAISREGHLPLILQRAATPNESVGHRYVTQYQLRVRMKGETQKELPVGVRGPRRYIELPPSSLPTPCTAPGEVTDMGEPETTEEALVAGLLGHFGTRYELMVDLEEKLWEVLMGHELLEASMRVGTEHRWSCWTPWSGAQGLQLPLPTPLKTSSASAEALGPTAIRVSWAPFDRAPGVTSLEYVIQAEPLLGEDGTSGSSSPAETVICFQHEPRKHDGQLVVTPQFQRLLDPKEMSGLGRLVSAFQDIRDLEGADEKDTKLQVEVSGLLPWTSYLVSVSARYPAGAGLYPRSQLEGKSGGLGLLVGPKLTTQVETPGGPNTPTPPRQVGWNDFAHDLGEDASFQPNMRAILLSIEDRRDYVLEYRACSPFWAHYDPQVGAALKEFQGSWPRQKLEEGAWKRVPTVKRLGKGFGEAYKPQNTAVSEEARFDETGGQKGKGWMVDLKVLLEVMSFWLCRALVPVAHLCWRLAVGLIERYVLRMVGMGQQGGFMLDAPGAADDWDFSPHET